MSHQLPAWAKHVTDMELLVLALEKQEQVGYVTVSSLVFAVREKINFAYQFADVVIKEQLGRLEAIKLIAPCTARERYRKRLYRFPAYVVTAMGQKTVQISSGQLNRRLRLP